MNNDIIGLRVSTAKGAAYFQPQSKKTRRLFVNTASALGSYNCVSTPVDELPDDVRDYVQARPDLAAELPRLRELITETFSGCKSKFSIVHHSPDEDDEPSLCIVVEHREPRDEARRKRRDLLSGEWLKLSAFTLGRTSLHLGKHRG